MVGDSDRESTGTSVPVLVKVGQDELNRLLGNRGKVVLGQVSQLIKGVAVDCHWPLEQVEIRHYHDPEVKGWEYLVIDLVLACSLDEAERYFLDFCDFLDTQTSHWCEGDRTILHEMIYFDIKAV